MQARPAVLPPRTYSLYTDGSFQKESKADPGTAGWGVCAVTGGDGDADADGQELCGLCAPLRKGHDAVEKLSNNTAELCAMVISFRRGFLPCLRPSRVQLDELGCGRRTVSNERVQSAILKPCLVRSRPPHPNRTTTPVEWSTPPHWAVLPKSWPTVS